MAENTNKNQVNDAYELGKKPLWFLFLGANVLVLLGCVITWALYKNPDITLTYLPMLIGNLLGIILAGVFIYFEAKDIAPKAMHFQKKWLKWYLASMIVFIVAILFTVLYYICFLQRQNPTYLKNNLMGWQFWIYFAITAILTLVSIGLQRYARFRIDLDVYRRKHGQNPNKPEEPKKESESKKPEQPKPEKSEAKKASGGLLDQM